MSEHTCPHCGGPTTPIPPDFGRRMRAARGFAAISQTELSQRIIAICSTAPAAVRTIKRIEDGQGSAASGRLWARWVSEATGVPLDFMLHGFESDREVEREALSGQASGEKA
ncbi:MAG: hypothetical protein WAU69_02455 [Solirubrobacteraceae bacterium]